MYTYIKSETKSSKDPYIFRFTPKMKMNSMWLPLLLVLLSQDVASEIIRPMADVDFKMVSLHVEPLEDMSYLSRLQFIGPVDTQVTLNYWSESSRIIAESGNGAYFSVEVKSPKDTVYFMIDTFSSSKGVKMQLTTYLSQLSLALDKFQNIYPINDFKYQIDRQMIGELAQITVQIDRPMDYDHSLFTGQFSADLISKEGYGVYEGYGQYMNSTTINGGDNQATCFLNLSAIKKDGLEIKDFGFWINDQYNMLMDVTIDHYINDI